MKILVTGASGFIGSQLVTDLIDVGFEVTCCVRDVEFARLRFPACQILSCDFLEDSDPELWLPRLDNIDVVINVVGVLDSPNEENIWKIHYHTPEALFKACVVSGVQKIIQISALGIESNLLAFSESKRAIDNYLLSLPLTGLIIRPSLVYGSGSFGGTSLLRALSALPFFIPLPNQGINEFQPIHVKDLTRSIINLLHKDLSSQIIVAVGPEKISLSTIARSLRRWLGFKPVPTVNTPPLILNILFFICKIFRCPRMSQTSFEMLNQNNISTPQEAENFYQIIDFTPCEFESGIFAQPSYVQDRWHARLYFLRPALRLSIGFLWVWSGLASVLFSKETSFAMLATVGVPHALQSLTLYSAATLNIILGIMTLFKIQLRLNYIIQCALIMAYSVIITFFLPENWWHPFAPIAKNIPILFATFILIALESER